MRISLLAAAQKPGNLDPGRGSSSTSQEGTAGQAPAAKGPPVPKAGGATAMQGPLVRPASDSAVMAKPSAKDPQTTGPLQGQFPTPAESLGRSVPVKKPPPTGKAEVSFELIEPPGSICFHVQHCCSRERGQPTIGVGLHCCSTWKGRQSASNVFPEGLCDNNHRGGPGGTVFLFQGGTKDP